ncbi:MAG: hypothetical protein B7X06_02735 [Verrucomicrobia bacterium 21-51-4]|nr:MAG: hypothetical protein B7X06_02735 [Verrucomicrobia bacterium 21-51-4]
MKATLAETSIQDIRGSERVPALLLLAALLLFGFWPKPLLDSAERGLTGAAEATLIAPADKPQHAID